MNTKTMNRRNFLKTIGALTISFGAPKRVFLHLGNPLPYIISSSALGKRRILPSERITLGAIGIGRRGRSVLKHFLTFNEVQCLAVCDVQKKHLDLAKAIVDEHYQNKDCIAYHDFRDLLANKNIDAVLIATGDRWHAVASIMAAKAGKDIYSEKPMSLTIEEGRALVETTKRFGTIYQCGHQRRSVDSYRFQTEVVQLGMIGKVHTVIAKSWENGICKPQAPQPVPDGLDYDMWLGPTPYHPFIPVRFHNWNNFWDTGGGTMINMACHYTDIAQWGLGKDDTGPIDFEGWAKFDKNNFADVPVTAEVTCTYADGTKLILKSQGAFRDRFIRFIGTEGWIQVDDETNVVTAEPKSILKRRGISARSWAYLGDHIQNFLDCIRSRRETICSPEKSHRATTIGHIANICNRLGRPLKWDPKTEQFINDPEANKMLSRSMRPPWHL